jgi:putative membrane-bound dehydrogenase-like protein
LFAEGLSFPTSVAPWKGGIFISAPPEIIYFKDTTGDGRADVREVVFHGFNRGVTDSNVNGLRWGLDNRIHGANGGNGGSVSSPRHPERKVPLGQADFSFNPATADFTLTFQTGGGFGLAFDDWGHSFATYNINHIQHRVLPVRYWNRFPGLPPVELTVSISDHEEMSRIYPISVPETRVNHPEQAGHFSAAGGMGYVGAPGYPGDLGGSVLVCDVVGNLVHRDVLEADGPSFIARRSPAEATREFIASRDNACRPVGLELGPDGALYLLDMQRDVIEHPDYIPDKVKARLNLRGGEDRGRIYRLMPKAGLPPSPMKLGSATITELVNSLSNSNQWQRLTAQRLLVERQDKTAVPLLKRLAVDGSLPLGQLHALWTLQGLGVLEESLVLQALNDPHPGLRENALILAEHFALTNASPLTAKILTLADDPMPRVRFQAALTIGELEAPESTAILGKLLRRDYGFRWSRLAVLSSLRTGAPELFCSLITTSDFHQTVDENKLALIRELADLIGARSGSSEAGGIALVLTTLADSNLSEPWIVNALDGLQSGVTRESEPVATNAAMTEAIQKLEKGRSSTLLAASWKLCRMLGLPETESQQEALTHALQTASTASRQVPERVAAIRLLGLGGYSDVKSVLYSMLEATQPAAVQLAAIETLHSFNEPEIGLTLAAQWRTLSPATRPSVINLLLQRRSYQASLLAAVEQGRIKVGELNLDLEQRRQLLGSSSVEIRTRAARFWGDEEYSNRKSIVTEWLAKLPPIGDAPRGREVFVKTCTFCHRLDGLGTAVGPDLSDAAHRSVEDLLSNILDPNMAINPAYVSYTAEWSPDEVATGIMQSETPAAVTLLQAQGIRVVIPRAKLQRLESSGLSLMPEGLEVGLTPQQLRDLIAFLQQRR